MGLFLARHINRTIQCYNNSCGGLRTRHGHHSRKGNTMLLAKISTIWIAAPDYAEAMGICWCPCELRLLTRGCNPFFEVMHYVKRLFELLFA
jgi:hypothetical protein